MHGAGLMRLTAVTMTLCLTAVAAAVHGQDSVTDDMAGHRLRGLALPVKQVVLNAPMAGILAELLVEEGDDVAVDQLLARIDDRIQLAEVEARRLQAESQTEIRHAELALEEAQIMLDNIETIQKQGAASDWEVRRARLQRDQADAAVDAAKEQHVLAQVVLQREQERLALHHIKAPFAGRIIRTQAEVGVSLTTDSPILSLSALETLEAQIFLPVDLYGKLAQGQAYELDAGKPVNRVLTGSLKNIDSIVDPASQTFRCVFTIDNADKALPAGFAVRLVWAE